MILRGQRIVTNIPPKQHTIPADVLPNDSEAFFVMKKFISVTIFFNFPNIPEMVMCPKQGNTFEYTMELK